MISQVVLSPIGPLKLTVEDGFVTGLEFYRDTLNTNTSQQPQASKLVPIHTKSRGRRSENDLMTLEQAIGELNAYFSGRLRYFSVPVRASGTRFQQAVWQAMAKISYGQTKTYRDLAKAVGSPNGARAVGNACGANPVAIIIPCHRVVAQNALGGFGGGLYTKRWLLELEKHNTRESI